MRRGIAVLLAVAIAMGAGSFTFFYSYLYATLPLDGGDRIVGLENWDAAINNQEPRSLHDFSTWRRELTSMEEIGAFQTVTRNVIVPGAEVAQISGAEMTASGFRVARVAPLLGRHLVADDERPGAESVVVIGYDLWRRRFVSDPAVVGRSIRLGGAVHTVIGVMPERFAFPINHRFWIPLRAEPLEYARRKGPALDMFGRLAPGVTVDGAQAELTTIGLRTAAAFPATHAHIRPRIVPYTALLFDDTTPWQLHTVQFLVTLLVIVVGVNVAILVYARTATRHGEIVVRSALGASRRRIVAQLFVEALVFTIGAAAVGLVLASLALKEVDRAFEEFGGAPFWADYRLTRGAVLYVLGVALLGAAIAGVIPALKATGRHLESGLRQLGGGTRMQLGKTWSALIVVQVAFAVALLPGALFMATRSIQAVNADPGFAVERFLTVRLVLDRDRPSRANDDDEERAFASRYADRLAEFVRRVEAEAEVAGVSIAAAATGEEPTVRIEIDGAPAPESASGHAVRFSRVDVDFFDTFEAPLLAGRQFRPGDVDVPVIVNRAFAEQIGGGGNLVGRRIRYVEGYRSGGVMRTPEGVALGRWYDIVGVVGNLPANPIIPGEALARLYHPLAHAPINSAILNVRVRTGDPAALTSRLREIAIALDPAVRLDEMLPLKEMFRRQRLGLHWGALAFALVTLSVVLLSAGGIYALMSFTITRRRREIGIRVALGAHPRTLLRHVCWRAFAQLAVGVVAGLGVATVIDIVMDGELMGGYEAVLLPAVSAVILVVGMLAAFGPARRGLRIQPIEALREE